MLVKNIKVEGGGKGAYEMYLIKVQSILFVDVEHSRSGKAQSETFSIRAQSIILHITEIKRVVKGAVECH